MLKKQLIFAAVILLLSSSAAFARQAAGQQATRMSFFVTSVGLGKVRTWAASREQTGIVRRLQLQSKPAIAHGARI
jgi:hypothetical protein